MSKNYGKWAICLGFVLVLTFTAISIVYARVAVINAIKGPVEVQKAGATEWRSAAAKMELYINDKVQTRNGAMCEILLDDGSLLKLKENTTLEINDLSEDPETKKKSSIFKLLLGKLWAKAQLQQGSKFDVVTPTAIAGIRGTEFAIIVAVDGTSDVFVFKGSVEVKSLREEIGAIRAVIVEAGKALGIKPGEIGLPRDLTPQEIGDWNKFIESKGKVEIKLTEAERTEIRSEVAELRQELREQRLFGLEVKKSDFAAGRTMKDRNKVLCRVEQRLYRPTAESIRFLNMTMRYPYAPENLQYYQMDWQFSGAIPSSIVSAIVAIASNSVHMTKAESLWANAAPGVTKRDEFVQGWDEVNNPNGYLKINGVDKTFDKDIAPSTTPSTNGELNSSVRFYLGSGGTNYIKMDGWVINNDGKVLTANDFVNKNAYDMLRNEIGLEIAWDLNNAGVTINKGGVIDVVFIPNIVFVMADAAINELRNLASISFGQ